MLMMGRVVMVVIIISSVEVVSEGGSVGCGLRSEEAVVVESALGGGVVVQNVLTGRVGSGWVFLLFAREHDR